MPDYLPQVQLPTGLAEALIQQIQRKGEAWSQAISGLGQNISQGINNYRENKQNTLTPEQAQGIKQLVNAPPVLGNEKQSFAGGIGSNQPMTSAQRDLLSMLMQQKATEERMMGIQNLKGEQAITKDHTKVTPEMIQNYPSIGKMGFKEGDYVPNRFLGDQSKPKSPSLGLRDEQFWERQKVAAGKALDLSTASSRSPLGVAVTNNQKARRALKLLNSKGEFTPQDQSLITTDLTAMMKGGSPDEELLRQQQYGNIYTSGVSLLQKITSKPQNLNDPEIKQHLKEVITGIVNVDDNQINDHIDAAENQYSDLISRDPKWWEKAKKTASRNLFTEGKENKDSSKSPSNEKDPLGIL